VGLLVNLMMLWEDRAFGGGLLGVGLLVNLMMLWEDRIDGMLLLLCGRSYQPAPAKVAYKAPQPSSTAVQVHQPAISSCIFPEAVPRGCYCCWYVRLVAVLVVLVEDALD
jgi:hypothetical protein